MALAVVDASVVVKWFVVEADSGDARRLRDDFLAGIVDVRAPSLLPFEVLNALRFHPTFPQARLRDAGLALDRAGIATVPLFGDYLGRTIELATREGITIYDASYAALAEIENCPLYTSDDRILGIRRDGFRAVNVTEYTRESSPLNDPPNSRRGPTRGGPPGPPSR